MENELVIVNRTCLTTTADFSRIKEMKHSILSSKQSCNSMIAVQQHSSGYYGSLLWDISQAPSLVQVLAS